MNLLRGAMLTSLASVFLCSLAVASLIATDRRATGLPFVDLPITTIRGDWRGLCEDLRIIVTVRIGREGLIETWVRKKRIRSRIELTQKLLVFSERKRDMEHPLQPSEVFVDIRAGKDVPWWAVRRVLDACQDPDVRMYKLLFSVRRPAR